MNEVIRWSLAAVFCWQVASAYLSRLGSAMGKWICGVPVQRRPDYKRL